MESLWRKTLFGVAAVLVGIRIFAQAEIPVKADASAALRQDTLFSGETMKFHNPAFRETGHKPILDKGNWATVTCVTPSENWQGNCVDRWNVLAAQKCFAEGAFDATEARRIFLQETFGPAAPEMREYFRVNERAYLGAAALTGVERPMDALKRPCARPWKKQSPVQRRMLPWKRNGSVLRRITCL